LTAVTPSLDVTYLEFGAANAQPAVVLHGWPYDVRCYDSVVASLAESGYRAIVPYLRGFEPTAHSSDVVMGSAQQSALAKDVIDLLDALKIKKATLAG
jgi:pimeloyl-ACP methyl ester carboxylesterase